MVNLPSMEEPMPLHSDHHETETEIAYWRSRVASLEVLVCELLAKNQHMRFALVEPATPAPRAKVPPALLACQ